MVILGDRYELLGSAISAMSFRCQLHIFTVAKSKGVFDDSIRNSISKLSHLHFPVHEQYKKRLIQLGKIQKPYLIMVDQGLIQYQKLNYYQDLN